MSGSVLILHLYAFSVWGQGYVVLDCKITNKEGFEKEVKFVGPGLVSCTSVILSRRGCENLIKPSVRIFGVSVDIRVETSEYKSEPLPPDTGCSVEFRN